MEPINLAGQMKTPHFLDPSTEEMLSHLKETYKGLLNVESDEDFGYSAHIAMYWYANFYHSGMNSNLYSSLSTSVYSPNFQTFEGDMEDPSIEMMYSSLEDKFGKAEE